MTLNPHGDSFLLNTKSLIMTMEQMGAQPIEIRVAPDILRRFPAEIKHFLTPPEKPGEPPRFMGLPFRQDPSVQPGTVLVITRQHVN